MEKTLAAVFLGIGIIVVATLIGLLFTFPLMWLINWLIAPTALMAVFGTAKLGFWQVFVLSTICGSLFKSYNLSSK